MASENQHFDETLTAGADLSTHQYKFVKLSAARTAVICAAATDKPIGVLQNKPTSGTAATVRVFGETKVIAGGTIAAGDSIGTDANGLADTKVHGTDTTQYAVGEALTAAVVNDIFTSFVNCTAAGRAT